MLQEKKRHHYRQIRKYFTPNSQQSHCAQQDTKNTRRNKIQHLSFSLLDELIQRHEDITSLLDAGCGKGEISYKLAQSFPSIRRIIGVDFLADMVTQATANTPDNSARVMFLQSDVLALPFPDKLFDVTVCLDMLHHIHPDDFTCALTELARVTKRYLLLEIINRKNIFTPWYTYVLLPFYFKNLPVYPTSLDEVTTVLASCDVRLYTAQRIASTRWSCRRLVVVYEKKHG